MITPSLPPQLERQRALIYNLYWAWQHDAREIFCWDRDPWERSGHNPVLMPGRIDQATLETAAVDERFLVSLDYKDNLI